MFNDSAFKDERTSEERSKEADQDLGTPLAKGKYAVAGRGINKHFEQLCILDNLSINIPRGVTYCLLGPNGSGKTTLMRGLMGLVRLDSGTVFVLDEPLNRINRIYSKLGYMPQQRPLYPDLTVKENLEFYAGIYGISGQKLKERIKEVLEVVGLSSTRDRVTGKLSGGMYQRISLACTLVHSPELLLLDEPTVGIDPVTKESFWDYFRTLTRDQGNTIIFSTHIMEEAERCDLAGFMRAGRMMAESTPDDLKRIAKLSTLLKLKVRDPVHDVFRLEEMGFEAHVEGGIISVILPSRDSMHQILSCEGLRPLEFELLEPTLEDAFLRLAG
jgi:ABC-2 type transport system ATP-binding protein